jgi:hypothetical protein
MKNYKNITESGVIVNGFGTLNEVVINSHNGGTLKFYDGLEGGAQATATFTSTGALAAGSHPVSVATSSGAMVAGTHAVTVFTGTGNFQEGVKASGVLTSDGVQVTAGSTVVVADVTYTFVAFGEEATNGATACDVPLGATAQGTMDNLYNSLKYNPKVDVVKTSALVITVTAKSVGTAGNSYAKTEDDAHLDWDGVGNVLTGGVAADTVTIGSTVYTAKTTPGAAYDFAIGADLEASLVNLANAISGESSYAGTVAHTQVVVAAYDATTITLRGRVPGTSLNTVATTETCANASFPDTTLGGGTGASDAGVTTAAATITIGTTVYTVVDELSENYGASPVAYQVVKGANEAAMIANLKLAINGTGIAGTNYSTGTLVHPLVRCTASDATTLTVKGIVPGISLNATPTTTTMANTAWADTTLGGGTGASDAGIATTTATITVGTRTYTFVTELTETILGTTTGAIADQIYYVTSVAVALDNMKLAINGTGIAGTNYSTGTTPNAQVTATTNANDSQVIVAKVAGTSGNSIATTDTLANHAWGAGTMASGTGSDSTPIGGTITFSAVATTGERVIPFGDLSFSKGLYATIGGTAADLTVVYS